MRDHLNPRQTALITGASAGIGREFAKVFAENGFNLVIVARSQDKLEALASSLCHTYGVDVTVVVIDLTEPRACQRVFEKVQKEGIEIEVLVNNAGINFHGYFKDITLQDHLKLLQLNVIALTALTCLFLKPMIERGHGRILNVASLGAFQPVPSMGTYAATKAYVLSLSETLAIELSKAGVTVTALCPGFTDTAMRYTVSATTGHPTPVPDFLVSLPEKVAHEGYQACMRGDPVYISGFFNQVTAHLFKYQPSWLKRATLKLLFRRAR